MKTFYESVAMLLETGILVILSIYLMKKDINSKMRLIIRLIALIVLSLLSYLAFTFVIKTENNFYLYGTLALLAYILISEYQSKDWNLTNKKLKIHPLVIVMLIALLLSGYAKNFGTKSYLIDPKDTIYKIVIIDLTNKNTVTLSDENEIKELFKSVEDYNIRPNQINQIKDEAKIQIQFYRYEDYHAYSIWLYSYDQYQVSMGQDYGYSSYNVPKKFVEDIYYILDES